MEMHFMYVVKPKQKFQDRVDGALDMKERCHEK